MKFKGVKTDNSVLNEREISLKAEINNRLKNDLTLQEQRYQRRRDGRLAFGASTERRRKELKSRVVSIDDELYNE